MDVNVDISNGAQSPLLCRRIVTGSVDFQGRPAIRSKSGCWKSTFYMLGAVMAERFAYHGVRSNLVSYLTGPMGQSTATAVVNVNVWTGFADLSPLLGALAGDAFLGRYRAILGSGVFYVLGLGFLALSAALHSFQSKNSSTNDQTHYTSTFNNILFFCSLYLVALMQGVCRPCLQAFGAEQFDDEDEKELKAKSSFFNWWNFSISIGSLIAFSLLNYVQDNMGWELGFGIPCIVMLFSFLVFLLGTRTYRFRINSGERNSSMKDGRNCQVTPTAVVSITKEPAENICCQGTQFKLLEKDLFSVPEGSRDHVEKVSGTHETEDAKAILNLVPLWCSTCLGVAIVTAQTSTLFTKQGATMERHITPSFQIPAASLQSLMNITLVIILPVYDLIFVPMARVISKNSLGITVLQRIGTGLVFSIISVTFAAIMEKKRLTIAAEYGLVDMVEVTIPMSIWWLIPQYLAQGLSQCFTNVGIQQLFYEQVPSDLKSMGIALYFSVFGIGNFISSFLVLVIEKVTGGDGGESWFSNKVDEAHVDYFYWLLVAISSVAFAAYVYFARCYVYTRN